MLLVGLVLLAQHVFSHQLSARGRYLLWLPVVLALVLPLGFALPLPVSVFPEAVETGATLMPAFTEPASVTPAAAEPALLTEAAASFRIAALGLTDWLSLLWLTGALLVLSLFLRAAREGLALTRDTGPAGEDLAALFHECRQLAGGSTSVRLQVSLRVEVPAVCGLFNPVLLWPAGLAFSRLRQDRELACDAATLACLGKADNAAYAHTLLRVGACLPATPRVLPGLAILDPRRQLQQRIHMLLAAPRSQRLQSWLTGLLCRQAGFQNFTVEAMQRTNDIAAGVW